MPQSSNPTANQRDDWYDPSVAIGMRPAVRRRLAIAGAGAIGIATWLGAVADADACTCSDAWSLLGPAAGEHPRDAVLVFESSCGGSFEPWSVTVDGVPASFGERVNHGEIATMAISPAPTVGAEVVVLFDCSEGAGDPACAAGDSLSERARFTIVAPDTIAPPPALELTMALVADDSGTDCSSVEDQRPIEVSIEIGEREPGSWVELTVARVDGVTVARTGRPLPEAGGLTTVIHVQEDALEFPEICVDAVVHDASGNIAPAVQDCEVQDGNVEGHPLFRRGCTCAATTAPAWHSVLLGLLVLMVRRRRP